MIALLLGIRAIRSSADASVRKLDFSPIAHANTLFPFARSRIFSCTKGAKGRIALYKVANQDVRKNYMLLHMIFTMTEEQQRACPKLVVDVVSIQHGKYA